MAAWLVEHQKVMKLSQTREQCWAKEFANNRIGRWRYRSNEQGDGAATLQLNPDVMPSRFFPADIKTILSWILQTLFRLIDA